MQLLHSCFLDLKLSESLIDFSVMSLCWMEECLAELMSVGVMVHSYV